MTNREKKLAAAVAILIMLGVGNWGWQKYSTWKQSATARKTTAATDLQAAMLEQTKTRRAVNKLRAWREQSLPANAAVAQSQYRAWLVELLQDAGLDVTDVTPRPTGQQSSAYKALGFEAEASGTLTGVVKFLDAFYRSDQLQKISSLRLAPMNDDNDQLRVTLNVEAIVVNGTERQHGLPEATSNRLALASASEYVERIAGRNPFVAYKPPAPLRPKVVERPRPKPAEKPKFNHAEHAQITGFVSEGDNYEAWVTVHTLGERLYLQKGDEVKVGAFEGTVIDVYRSELLIDTDAGLLAFGLGDKLTDGKKANIHERG